MKIAQSMVETVIYYKFITTLQEICCYSDNFPNSSHIHCKTVMTGLVTHLVWRMHIISFSMCSTIFRDPCPDHAETSLRWLFCLVMMKRMRRITSMY